MREKLLKPFPFSKSFLMKKKLQKLTDKKIIYTTSRNAYCNLNTKKIFLPFVEPLEYDDLKTLLEHEEKHFSITKCPAKIPKTINIVKAQRVLNYLEDMVVNKHLKREKLERIFKKLSAEREQLTLWLHYDNKEKLNIIRKLKRLNVFRDIPDEEIVSTIDETIKEREKYDSVRDFVTYSPETFRKYYELFSDNYDDTGDGPCVYEERYNLPDWDLMKKFEKLIKNLKTVSMEEYRDETFIGHRINRKFFEDISCIKPFNKKTIITSVNLPKIVILLDCSGSMVGYPEKVAKSFIVACLRHLETVLVAHNQYYTNIVKNPETAVKLPMTGDEHFHKLQPKQYSCDIFVVITDMNINDREAKGLKEFGEKVSAKRKYILCVDPEHYSSYPELDNIYRRVAIDTSEKFLQFVKHLCYL